jgi:transcriptional regulator with XRE-family HTH domain
MDFSERLEALMESHKVTIGHLSKETGISKSSLHGYLQGAEASMSNAVKLADYFDVSLDFLIVGKKELYVRRADEVRHTRRIVRSYG